MYRPAYVAKGKGNNPHVQKLNTSKTPDRLTPVNTDMLSRAREKIVPSSSKKEQEERDSQPTDFQCIVAGLEKLGGGLNSKTADLIGTWLEKHALACVEQAIAEAAAQNARSAAYVDKILIGWEAKGYPNTRDEQVAERKAQPSRTASKADAVFRSLQSLSMEYSANGE